MDFLQCYFYCCHFSKVDLFVISVNTVVKLTIFLFSFAVGNIFFHLHYWQVILHHIRSIYFLITMGRGFCQVVLFYLSLSPYIFVPIFLSVIPLDLLLLCFLHSFGSLCYQGCLEILYVMCCFSVYTGSSVSIHSFLALGVGHLLLLVIF